MTLTELDSLRADTMTQLLNEEGRRYIWRYDVTEARVAVAVARANWNFDGIERGAQAILDRKSYALIGPGIEDHYFTTPEELVGLVTWLCHDGYLSSYRAVPPS